jgi:hypothetical protein
LPHEYSQIIHTGRKEKLFRFDQNIFFLDDRSERINRHSDPNLRPHRVLRRPIKRLDAEILLDPAEKQFDAPAEFVELGDRQRRLKKVIGQKREVTLIKSADYTKSRSNRLRLKCSLSYSLCA